MATNVSEENWISCYRKPDPSLWIGRTDTLNSSLETARQPQRIHEVVQLLDLESATDENGILNLNDRPDSPNSLFFPSFRVAIIGFCSDLGIQRNKGRVGAADAPPVIRSRMANLAIQDPRLTILDSGDVVVENVANKAIPKLEYDHLGALALQNTYSLKNASSRVYPDPLKQAQELLSDKISLLIRHKIFTLILGGGHEVAKPHYDALKRAFPGQKIGIINLDAHFDLRQDPLAPTSGTSFYEIWESEIGRLEPKLVPKNLDEKQQIIEPVKSTGFHYLTIGIQSFSNTPVLYETAKKTGTQFIEAKDIPISGITSQQESEILTFMESVDRIMLTICMDVFQSAVSPGVSAPSPLGMFPSQIIQILSLIQKSGKVISADIAETNPILDQDGKTSALASFLGYHLICSARCIND